MAIIASWDFETAGAPDAEDGAPQNGAQDGSLLGVAALSGGAVQLDGADDRVFVAADPVFQLSTGTLLAEVVPDAVHDGTILSRDSSGFDDGGHFTAKLLADGSVWIRSQTDSASTITQTAPGFYDAGDALRLSFSWEAGTGGLARVVNDTTGADFQAAVPPEATWDMGPSNEAILIGASQQRTDTPEDPATLIDFFSGEIGLVEIHDTAFDGIGRDFVVSGSAGADLIDADYAGDPEGDRIDAGDAADGSDDDIVAAGAGADTVFAGDGADIVLGGAGDDSLVGGDGADSLSGGEGADTIWGGGGVTTRDLVVNGSFEDTTGASDTGYGAVATGAIVGWTATDPAATFDFHDDGKGGTFATDGQYTMDMGGSPSNLEMYQDVAGVIAGETYTLTFDAGDLSTHPTNAVEVFWGGDLVALVDPTPGTMENYTFTLTGGAGDGSDRLAFREIGAIDNHGVQLDDIRLVGPAAGPEDPSADTLRGGEGDDVLHGEAGDDRLFGEGDDDRLYGGDGADLLDGGAGADSLFGGADRDTIFGGPGDSVEGGEAGDDLDTLVVSGVSRIDWDPADPEAGTVHFTGGGPALVFSEIEAVEAGRDGIVSGTGAGERIDGGYTGDPDGDVVDGDDAILPGTAGDDDSIEAGGGADTIDAGAGHDTIRAGAGDDVATGGAGDDLVDGGAGTDTLTGGPGDDSVLGGAGDDVLRVAADDVGSDTLDGGDDADRIEIDSLAGDHVVRGGEGGDDRDTLDLSGAPGPVDVTLTGDEAGTVTGPAGSGTTTFSEIEGLRLTGGADSFDGSAAHAPVAVEGGAGADTLAGGGGADTLRGGDDADLFVGGSDGDVVTGGEGGDDRDVLDLTGAGPVRVTYEADDPEAGTVSFLDGAGGVTGTMTFSEIETVTFIPCFTPGARVATPAGLCAVEALRPGDRVLTRDSGAQEIAWTGTRALSAAEIAARPALAPVRIRAGALGPNRPARDMLVSPQHRMLVEDARGALMFGETELFVPALHLLGRPGVERAGPGPVTYVHFLCARHEVVLADGAWSESYQPGPNVLGEMDRAAREELFALFPDLRADPRAIPAARPTLTPREAALLLH